MIERVAQSKQQSQNESNKKGIEAEDQITG
jgi:hypothetical protein